MKKNVRGLFAVACLLAGGSSGLSATMPQEINYQGFIKDGTTAITGIRKITFAIYDGAGSTATKTWSEEQFVSVADGRFSVVLGRGTHLSGPTEIGTLFEPNSAGEIEPRFIGITVESGSELEPRLQVLPNPVALQAFRAQVANRLENNGEELVSTSATEVRVNTLMNITTGNAEDQSLPLTIQRNGLSGSSNPNNTVQIGLTADEALFNTTAPVVTFNKGLKIKNLSGTVSSIEGDLKVGGKLEVGKSVLETMTVDNKPALTLAANEQPPELYLLDEANGEAFLGFGTNVPQRKLHVHLGSSGAPLMVSTDDGGTITEVELWANRHSARLGTSTAHDLGFFTHGKRSEQMVIKKTTGRVGINTTSPEKLLHVHGTAAEGLMMVSTRINEADTKMEMYASSTFAGLGTTTSHPLGFFTHGSAPQMYLTTGGRVGIGTTSPTAGLHVSKTHTHASGSHWVFRNNHGGGESVTSSPKVSIRGEHTIMGGDFVATSDRRIKRNIRRTDTANDLMLVNRIEVSNYQLADHIGSGEAFHRGVIAQQVKEVLPLAVQRNRGWIPDIYEQAKELRYDAEKSTLILTVPEAHGLNPDDRVRLITPDGNWDLDVVAVHGENGFSVTGVSKKPEWAFVFGREVDDFLTVNYDALFVTGLGAIQELTRRLESVEKRESRIADLEAKAARVTALEAKVLRLESMVNRMLASSDAPRVAEDATGQRIAASRR